MGSVIFRPRKISPIVFFSSVFIALIFGVFVIFKVFMRKRN